MVVGLEVHAQLLTKSKIFAADATTFGDSPNTNISVITLAHPGSMPVFNREALTYAIKMGLACHCEITRKTIFDRKNYFYPDLPKGYQVTQDKTPICMGGYVTIKNKKGVKRKLVLQKIHLEEDAGKSIHLAGEDDTLIDFNRAGVPLIEIVTEPVLRSSEEAGLFLVEVRKLVRYLEICDGNMEEGSMRCDANVSIRPKGATELGEKVEVKNMNSIRNVQRAIEFEVERQIKLLEAGQPIISETRTFNADTYTTSSMRTKETLNDYRYFPDPDLSPVVVSESWLENLKNEMPPLPGELLEKFVSHYKLPEYDAAFLTETKEIAAYFEEICQKDGHPKAVSNWMMGPVKSVLNENNWQITDFPITAQTMADLIQMVLDNVLSFTVASRQVFPELLKNPDHEPLDIAREHHLIQEKDTDSIQPIIDEVIARFPDKVKAYRHGKKGLIGMFMGEVMKKSKVKVDPKLANELLRKTLG